MPRSKTPYEIAEGRVALRRDRARLFVRDLGLAIETARRGRDVADLAEAAGVSPATWYRYETGRVDIPASKLLAVALALGITPGGLIRGLAGAAPAIVETRTPNHES